MNRNMIFCLSCCLVSFVLFILGIIDLRNFENVPEYFWMLLKGYFLYFIFSLVIVILYGFRPNINDCVKLRFVSVIFFVLVVFFSFLVTNKTGLYLPKDASKGPMLIKIHDFLFFKYILAGGGSTALVYWLVHK